MKRAAPGSTEAFLRAYVDYIGSECVIWPFAKSKGYGTANVGGQSKYASHWMCVLAHGEPPSPRHEAAHSCGCRPCINPRHLRWATKRENEADKEAHGTIPRGERHVNTRLTSDDVRAIRCDRRPLRIIAAAHGISRTSACQIRSGKRWGHLLLSDVR